MKSLRCMAVLMLFIASIILHAAELDMVYGVKSRANKISDNTKNLIAKKSLLHADELLEKNVPLMLGEANATVTVTEFYDYHYRHGERYETHIIELLKSHPEVRFIFRPIVATDSERLLNLNAAVRGIQIWKSAGAVAWQVYQNKLNSLRNFNEHIEVSDINIAAHIAVKGIQLKGGIINPEKILSENTRLAHTLSINEMPVVIVMPVIGANPGNLTVLTDETDKIALADAVGRANCVSISPSTNKNCAGKVNKEG